MTQGNWKGRYGSEGYAILNDSTNYPAYATVTPSGKADYVWAAQPDTDARALQRGVAAGRIAACWYSGSSFNVDVNLTDQATHRVTVYLLDWDARNRVTRIDVLDASTQQVLATQTAPAHTQGVHMVWDLRGHVTLRFTRLGGSECRTERHLLRPGDGSADVFGQRHGHRERRAACRGELRGPRRRDCAASNAQGNYACTVPQGWSGTVTPSLNGYSFAPTSRNYSSVAANQSAQDYNATVVTATTTTTLTSSGTPATAGTTVTFTATVAGSNPTGSVSFAADAGPPITGVVPRATGAGNSKTATAAPAAWPSAPTASSPTTPAMPAMRPRAARRSSQVINPAGSAAASFVATDLVTQGNWKGRYGSEGYAILNDSTSYPAYATVTPSGKADHVWAAQPDTDARALQRGVAAGRIAACWYSGSSFNVDVNLTDQATHRVTVYLLDWDARNRVTRIDVLDASTQQVLATQTAPAHTQGVHMVWDLRGHVTLRFTRLGGIECRTERHLLRPGDGRADVFGQRHGHRERRAACRA